MNDEMQVGTHCDSVEVDASALDETMLPPASVSVTEASEISGYSRNHITWLVRKGKIKFERIGKRVLLIDVASLANYVERMHALGSDKYAGDRAGG